MDQTQGTSKSKEDSGTSFIAPPSIPTSAQHVSDDANQRLVIARERNDKNRDHLNTALNAYREVYGEDAAKEAFMEIAGKISAEEDDSTSGAFSRPESNSSSTQVAVDGNPTTPRYLSYRQSLSSFKDRMTKGTPDNSNHPVQLRTGTHNVSPSSITSYHGSEVIRDDEEQDNDNPAFSPEAIPTRAEPTMLSPSAKMQADVDCVDEGDTSRAVTSAASDITGNTPSQATAPEPPRYIKYRASLGDRSVASSIQSESSKMIKIGSVEASENDNNSTSPSATALSATATAGYLTPIQMAVSNESDSMPSGASTEAVTGVDSTSSLPRYVKYRNSLSKRSRGEMTSISENLALPPASHADTARAIVTPPTIRTSSEITREASANIRDEDMQTQNDQPATQSSAVAATAAAAVGAVAVGAAVGLAAIRSHPEDIDNSNNDGASVQSSASSVSSSQRYMAYRSTLKDRPWTPSLQDNPLLTASQAENSPIKTAPTDAKFEPFMESENEASSDRQMTSESLQPANVIDDEKGLISTDNVESTSPRDDESGGISAVESSAAASTASILSDLATAEQDASVLHDNRTMVSELTESSSRASTSIAELVLRSASSASDDEGMGGSVADHSAATPIISNSAQNKLKYLKEPTGNYLYNSDSSFDTDIDTDTNLMYMANVPASLTRELNNQSRDFNTSAIVSAPSSYESGNVPSAIDKPKSLYAGSIHRNTEDVSTSVVSDGSDERNVATTQSADYSQSALGRTDSSDADSSGDSSASSSSSSASSSSSQSPPPLMASANVNASYDSIVPTNTNSFGSQIRDYSDLYKRDSNKVPAVAAKPTIYDVSYPSSDDEEIGRGAEVQGGDDPEAADKFLKGNQNALWQESEQREKSLRRRHCLYRILFFTIVTLSSAAAVGGVLYSKSKNKDISVPAPESSSPSATSPTSSTPTAASVQPGLDPELLNLLATSSSDNGTALATPDTPQSDAFVWLANDPNLDEYTDTRKIQRYALTSFYYSTFGKNWTNNTGWGTYTDECFWFSRSTRLNSCDESGDFQNLDLAFNEVSGRIPPEIGMLTKLSRFIISGGLRRKLIGTLPTELGLLTRMEIFMVQGNSLKGIIPEALGNWGAAETVDLSLNSLFGTIPSSLGSWQSLRFLDLSVNRLVGQIPDNINQLTNLERLSLGTNVLTGTIPTTIENLANLKVINLEKNMIKGLPVQIANMERLETLIMSENQLQGTLIKEIGNLISLRQLKLDNNGLTGPIPPEIGNIASLRYLDLSHNNFTSSIPPQIGNLAGLLTLQLEYNKLEGTVPPELAQLADASIIRIDSNNLTGSIPTEVCTAFRIEYPAFYVDCGGEQPEVFCPESCCTSCCSDGVGCECTFQGTFFDFLCRNST